MKNIAIGVMLAGLLTACASEPPVGDLKKQGRSAGVTSVSAVDSAPNASVAVGDLAGGHGAYYTQKPAVSIASDEVTTKAISDDTGAKAVVADTAARVAADAAVASVVADEVAAKAATDEAAAKAATDEAVAKAEALAAVNAADVQNAELEAARAAAAREAANAARIAAELEATKAAAAKAEVDAAAARDAANAAAARDAANAARIAAELEAAKAAAANAAAARDAANSARIAAELEAAKVAAANAAAARDAAKARDVAKVDASRNKDDDFLGLLSKHSVYYPTDGDVVPAQDKLIVHAHAKYLAEHQNRSVRLEGHADERGSSEYNLALGQRRADGVRKMLVVGGVKESQIESVSYGEEKPVATAHNEVAWSQNRRTDLNYDAK